MVNGEDDTTFDLRVAMSAHGSQDPDYVNHARYFVKDPGGYYCRWDAGLKQFVSLDISDYNELAQYMAEMSDEELAAVRFETSARGAVSKIPGGYSVEFRGLPVDSSFKVEEWDSEIPSGYSLVEYERDKGSYTLTETETPAGYMPLSGPVTIKVDESGAVEDTFADVKDVKLADGAVQITNRAGVALPSTGGMGTTVFYVIGGVLVVGAAGALLVLAGAAIKFRK